MPRRRSWLALFAVAGLVILVYAAVVTAFSVTVTDQMERANRGPNAAEPAVGSRALVIPITDPSLIPTVADPRGSVDVNGTLIVAGDEVGSFPSSVTNASMGRALAYVAPSANMSYVPPLLTLALVFVDEANATERRENVTIDVSALAGGRTGFILKGDAEGAPRFAERDRVAGSVSRFEPTSRLITLYVVGGFCFLMPIVTLIATHKGAGRAGPGAVPTGACPECRASVAPSDTFCYRCGAYVDGRGRA